MEIYITASQSLSLCIFFFFEFRFSVWRNERSLLDHTCGSVVCTGCVWVWNYSHCDFFILFFKDKFILNNKVNETKKWIQCMGADNSVQIVWKLALNVLTRSFCCRSILYIGSKWVLLNKVYVLYTVIVFFFFLTMCPQTKYNIISETTSLLC